MKSRKNIQTVGILLHKNGQHNGKSEQTGAAITKKRKRNANHGNQANGHPDVDRDMHEKDAGDGIAKDSTEYQTLSFSHLYDSDKEGDIKQDHYKSSFETSLFAYGTEYEIRVLLRNKTIFGLGTFQESLAP